MARPCRKHTTRERILVRWICTKYIYSEKLSIEAGGIKNGSCPGLSNGRDDVEQLVGEAAEQPDKAKDNVHEKAHPQVVVAENT